MKPPHIFFLCEAPFVYTKSTWSATQLAARFDRVALAPVNTTVYINTISISQVNQEHMLICSAREGAVALALGA